MDWDDKEDDIKEKNENKLLNFCIIWVEDKNIAILLLEHGFAEV